MGVGAEVIGEVGRGKNEKPRREVRGCCWAERGCGSGGVVAEEVFEACFERGVSGEEVCHGFHSVEGFGDEHGIEGGVNGERDALGVGVDFLEGVGEGEWVAEDLSAGGVCGVLALT